jgi:hypothetical protein
MALYSVERTDAPAEGEFVHALVIAGGAALARSAVVHLEGVKPNGSNLSARTVPTTFPGGATLIAAYLAE